MKRIWLITAAIMVAGAFIAIGCDGDNQPGSDLKIVTPALAAWIEGTSGSATVSATGGTKPYSWAFRSCAEIPPWINCQIGNSGPPNFDGIITGGPAPLLAPGSTRNMSPPFTVICTDAAGRKATKQFTIDIVKQNPTITAVPGTMCAGEMYSDQSKEFPCVLVATAEGGTPPYHYQSDTFREGPPPLSSVVGTQYVGLKQNGCLKGRIDEPGLYNFRVTVVDSVGQQATTWTSINVIECAEPVTHTILIEGGFSCFIIPEGAATMYSGASFSAIPVKEHSDICFQIMSPPSFPEYDNNVECPPPVPPTYCEVYVDSIPQGIINEYCFTDVTEDHTISASPQ